MLFIICVEIGLDNLKMITCTIKLTLAKEIGIFLKGIRYKTVLSPLLF